MATRVLWIATRNPGKLRELERLLGPLGLRLRSQGEAPSSAVVEEDQPTFAGNARKKAAGLARAIATPAMADDSGLCVDALGGRPGVNSARWAGPEAADRDRIQKLLDEMRSVPEGNRTAHFTCAICLVDPDGRALLEIEEQCPGAILMEPRGEGGFGYDPVFVATQHLDQPRPTSFAELSAKDKDAVSHRGKALRRLLAQLAGNLEHIPIERP